MQSVSKMTAHAVEQALRRRASLEKAKASAWFFKTGPGQYGEQDQFLGITVPEQRKIARQFADLPLDQLKLLLLSPLHECRLTALFILVSQFRRGEKRVKREIVSFYLKNRERVNNWDLVDSSAQYILGEYLLDKNRKALYKLARSKSLWDRRIAIIATAAFISQYDYDETLELAELLLHDGEDLIHKATGWMLREVGKKDEAILRRFLDTNAATMPRTMLRYAIEKLPQVDRKAYLKQKSA